METKKPFFKLYGYKLGILIRQFILPGNISDLPKKYDVYLAAPTSYNPDLYIVYGESANQNAPTYETVFLTRNKEHLDRIRLANILDSSNKAHIIVDTIDYIRKEKLIVELESEPV
jgi:hypothetical protein